MKRTAPATETGITLVEVMVAVAVFALAIGSVFQLHGQGLLIAEKGRDINRVTQTLQFQVENLRATTWSELVAQAGSSTIAVDADGVPTGGNAATPFGWQAFELRQTLTRERDGLYLAVLVANWTDRRGQDHSRSFTTYFTEDGLNDYYIRTT